MNQIINDRIRQSIYVKELILKDESIKNTINDVAYDIVKILKNGGKIVLCGNGGSASDSLHFAGEIVGRFQRERDPWPAIVLNSNVATMTAIANDFDFEEVYVRQAAAFTKNKDIFIGISTSGNSSNVLKALEMAKKIGAETVSLVGKDGGEMAKIADKSIIVPADCVARIQESHILIIHIICEIIEEEMENSFEK